MDMGGDLEGVQDGRGGRREWMMAVESDLKTTSRSVFQELDWHEESARGERKERRGM